MEKFSNYILAFAALALASTASASYYGDPIPVESGGTGVGSLTSNAFVIGNGTSGVTFLAPTANSIVTFNTSGAPLAVTGVTGEVAVWDGSGHLDSLFIANANIASGAAIDAAKIANGSVSSTEFQYLDGATGSIQAQINAIVAAPGGANASLSNLSGVAFNVDLVPNGDNTHSVGSVTNRIATVYTAALSGGTGSVSVPSSLVLSGASSYLTTASANTTASRAAIIDASNQLTSSAVTTTELGYLSGATAAIQTQLNGKVSKAGDTMTGGLAALGGIYYPFRGAIDLNDMELIDPNGDTQLSWGTTGVGILGTTASTVAIYNGSNKLASSAVTTTQLGYLSGATANIQSQINAIAMASPTVVVVDNAASPYSAAFGQFILCDTSSGNVTINMPLVATGNSGMSVKVKKVSASNSCIVAANVANTIDGLAGVTTTTVNQARTITSAGSALGGTHLYIE